MGLNIAHTEEIDMAMLNQRRIFSKVYSVFYHLGLGRLFTRKLNWQIARQKRETERYYPEEDWEGVNESRDKYLAYWGNPHELYFQFKNPLLKANAWKHFAVERGKGILDPTSGRLMPLRFFDCKDRMRRAVPLQEIIKAEKQPIRLSSGTKLKVESQPSRLIWEASNDDGRGPLIMELPTFVSVDS